jgi:hypothetical protein
MPSGKGSTATDIQIAAEGGTAIDIPGIMASDALGLAVVCVSTEEVNISSFMCFFVDDSKNSIGNNEAISPWSSGLLMKLCEMRKERLVRYVLSLWFLEVLICLIIDTEYIYTIYKFANYCVL